MRLLELLSLVQIVYAAYVKKVVENTTQHMPLDYGLHLFSLRIYYIVYPGNEM